MEALQSLSSFAFHRTLPSDPFNVWDDIVWYHVLEAISSEWKEPRTKVKSRPAAKKSEVQVKMPSLET